MSSIHLRRTSGIVAGAAALVVLAGCTGGAPENPDDLGPTVTESLPVPTTEVDRLDWALYAEPASLDPIFSNDFPPMEVLANVCESLARIAPDFSLEPALAESWEQPDELTIVYTLRDGVTFHSGAPLTAEDVAFSLSRNLDPDVGSFNAATFANVASITATGENEVTIALSQPDITLPQALATNDGRIVSRASVEAGGDSFGTPGNDLDCTGPYSLAEWSAGQSISLTRFDDYWDDSLPQLVKDIEFSFVRDSATRVNAMLSGEIDGTWGVPAAGYARLAQADSGILAFGRTSGSYVAMITNLDGALADERIRLALAASIDREGIISAALDGAAQPLYAPASPGTWGFAADVFEDAYAAIEADAVAIDPQALVEEAGVPSETLTIAVTSGQEEMEVVGAEMQRAAESLGIETEIVSLPSDGYNALYSDAAAREGIDMIFSLWQTRFPDPSEIYQYQHSENFFNLAAWARSDFDALLARAGSTQDPAERADLIVEAQALSVADPSWLPIYTPLNSVYLGEGLTGAPTSSVQLTFPWAAMIGGE